MKNIENIQAVIFDMDGVIADSEPLHFKAEKAILQEHGIEAPWSEWDKFTGLPETKIFGYIVENFSDGRYSVEQLLAAKYKVFLTLIAEKLEPVPGALEFIQRCRARFAKIALATSSVSLVQEAIFRRFELESTFDVIITEEHIQRGKPDPEPYLKTLDALKLSAQQCVVFEDSLNGVKSAKAAGCHVFGITTSFSAEQLRDAGADFVIDRFAEIYHQCPHFIN